MLKLGAKTLKTITPRWNYECDVYVMDGDYPAGGAKEFGAPVNLVLASETCLDWVSVTEPAYDAFSGVGVEIFVIPYTNTGILDLVRDTDAMNTTDEPTWMHCATPVRIWAQERA